MEILHHLPCSAEAAAICFERLRPVALISMGLTCFKRLILSQLLQLVGNQRDLCAQRYKQTIAAQSYRQNQRERRCRDDR